MAMMEEMPRALVRDGALKESFAGIWTCCGHPKHAREVLPNPHLHPAKLSGLAQTGRVSFATSEATLRFDFAGWCR